MLANITIITLVTAIIVAITVAATIALTGAPSPFGKKREFLMVDNEFYGGDTPAAEMLNTHHRAYTLAALATSDTLTAKTVDGRRVISSELREDPTIDPELVHLIEEALRNHHENKIMSLPTSAETVVIDTSEVRKQEAEEK